MGTPPSEPQWAANSAELWDSLINQASEPSSGTPAAVSPLAAQIDNAQREFNVFTSRALELEAAINRGEAVSDEDVGHSLDNARAWVEYFSPNGPLCRGFPASTAVQEYVDALARASQSQRIAQQWVDFFKPLWEKRSSSGHELAHDEEQCLQRAAQAEQTVSQRRMSFSLNSSSLSSQQMQSYIQELNDLLAKVNTWVAAAKGPACRQRLQVVIQKITSALELFQFSYRSRASFEGFQRQQGWLPPISGGAPTGRPGPGSPEWYAAVTGMNCYWCGQDLRGLPRPVGICPRCGRFPQPSSPI